MASDQEAYGQLRSKQAKLMWVGGTVDDVSSPVIIDVVAAYAEQQQVVNTVQLSSSVEHLQKAAPDIP